MTRFVETRRTCLAYSAGGHFAELMRAVDGIRFADCFHVTFRSERFSTNDGVRRYFLCHPRRRILRTLWNALQAMGVLIRERPAIIISTGADVAVPVLILGKLLFRARVIFIESAGDITPTLSGRLVYPFSDLFIVQWPDKLHRFPRAVLSDGLLL